MAKAKSHFEAFHSGFFNRHPHVRQLFMGLFYVLLLVLVSMILAVLAYAAF